MEEQKVDPWDGYELESDFNPPLKLESTSISPQKRHFVNNHGVCKPNGDHNNSQERTPIEYYYDRVNDKPK